MTLSPSVTWPSAAITTLEFLRTHRTVVERMRWRSEREVLLRADLEPAVAVEPETTDERIDISRKYIAGQSFSTGLRLTDRVLPNAVLRLLEKRRSRFAAISC